MEDFVPDQTPYKGSVMSPRKRILLVDDHAILRDGLRSILDQNQEFEVVAEAGSGAEALEKCKESKPDLVLLDLSLPKEDGFKLLREIKRRWPKILALLFTMHNNQQFLRAAMEGGADGYCLKDTPVEELLHAMHLVGEGQKYISAQLLDGLLDESSASSPKGRANGEQYRLNLTTREKEIIRLVAQGFTNTQIAETLFISHRTVDNHCTNIRCKLNLHSKQAIAVFAFRAGLM
jgi:DNA-binding NarL/FixJ family response regulator